MKFQIPILLLAALSLGCAEPIKPAERPLEVIAEVTAVKILPPTEVQPQRLIQAEGLVNTGGWTDIRLVPTPTLVATPGEIHLNFVGRRPAGMATMVMVPVTATFPLAADAAGAVIIHSGSGEVRVILP